MHIYFSGIGGAGLGPLAEIAQDAGFVVSGSDVHESLATKELEQRGIDVVFEQTESNIKAEHLASLIDWLVYTSALPDDHPELVFARQNGIRISKRDEFLSEFLADKKLKLIAVAGTHGKTTTTGMLIWALQQLEVPLSYSIGTVTSFGSAGKFDPAAKFFVYEADEYDRNFIKFQPALSLLPAVDYDHPDIYQTVEDYQQAFRQFMAQSDLTILSADTAKYLEPLEANYEIFDHHADFSEIALPGQFDRDDAYLASRAIKKITDFSDAEIFQALSTYPGVGRRFEKLADGLYSDYAHHPSEIKAVIAKALELNPRLVVIYEPHQNQRQLQFADDYQTVFAGASQLFWLPTFMPAGDREKADKVLQPADFIKTLKNIEADPAAMDDQLWDTILDYIASGYLVLGLSAGNLDAWLRGRL
ncbi:MAG: Mur ligase domain-containing protein [Candidatus Nomurabacteria bacterium]|jgi:UDP-N-acetylmuramate--alanine ligase|nr:Mur ligase domain-containing protein [Candidatus Nomurabacteria bacterium]